MTIRRGSTHDDANAVRRAVILAVMVEREQGTHIEKSSPCIVVYNEESKEYAIYGSQWTQDVSITTVPEQITDDNLNGPIGSVSADSVALLDKIMIMTPSDGMGLFDGKTPSQFRRALAALPYEYSAVIFVGYTVYFLHAKERLSLFTPSPAWQEMLDTERHTLGIRNNRIFNKLDQWGVTSSRDQ